MMKNNNGNNRTAIVFAALAALLVASPLAFADSRGTVDGAVAVLPLPEANEARGFALASIVAEGAKPTVLIPVGNETRFDMVIQLPYLDSDNLGAKPSTTLHGFAKGRMSQWNGDVIIEDDPTVAEVEGPVSLYFGKVHNAVGPYQLKVSWEPDTTYLFDPTDTTPFISTPLFVPMPDRPDQLNDTGLIYPEQYAGCRGSSGCPSSGNGYSSSGSYCRTNVGAGYGTSDGDASGDTAGGNIWKTYAELNFNVDIFWYGSCNSAGPSMYSTNTGYAGIVRGPNNMAQGGLYLIEIGVAHMGGESGAASDDGFGYKYVGNQPSIQLTKPSGGVIKLEDAYVKGLNKKDCTSWPEELEIALGMIPTAYWWSVVANFHPRTMCVTNWFSENSGSHLNYDKAGFKVTKNSVNTQYEHGGRIEVRAASTGEFKMPFEYTQHIYGTVRAHGNGDASFTVRAPVTTSITPAAKVVNG